MVQRSTFNLGSYDTSDSRVCDEQKPLVKAPKLVEEYTALAERQKVSSNPITSHLTVRLGMPDTFDRPNIPNRPDGPYTPDPPDAPEPDSV
ncbi:hypothetical protein BDR06DRAFT_964133, partial [Suillus hirtellus]